MTEFTHVFARRTRLRGADGQQQLERRRPEHAELIAVERLAPWFAAKRGPGVDSIDSEATRA
jgi:hypothetical protein